MSASAAQLVRQLLIDQGIGQSNPIQPWFVTWSSEPPDIPDQCITVYNTGYDTFGRLGTGETIRKPNILVRIRGLPNDEDSAFQKGQAIQTFFDTIKNPAFTPSVTIGTTTRVFQAIHTTVDLQPIGWDSKKNRCLLTINARISF